MAYNIFAYCIDNPISFGDSSGEGIVSALIGDELSYILQILEAAILEGPSVELIIGVIIITSISVLIAKIYQMSKGGKQNIRDTGLIGTTDEEIEKKIKDPTTPKLEKERLKKEQKARGNRNKKKREQMK